MTEGTAHKRPSEAKVSESRERMSREVGVKEERKLRGRREKRSPLWSWLGTFGLVGWSVAIPTVIGAFLGVWIDRGSEARHSWTLMLLVIGVIVGCINAWYWVKKESNRK